MVSLMSSSAIAKLLSCAPGGASGSATAVQPDARRVGERLRQDAAVDRRINEVHAEVRRRRRVGIVVARAAREAGLEEQAPVAQPREIDRMPARRLIGRERLRKRHEALEEHPQAEHREIGHRVAVMDEFPVEQRGDAALFVEEIAGAGCRRGR